jgi:hypothetical protein
LKNSIIPKEIPLFFVCVIGYVGVSDHIALPVATSAVSFLAGNVLERNVGTVTPKAARKPIVFEVENSNVALERIEIKLAKIGAVKGLSTVNAGREETVKYWRCKDVEISSVTGKSQSQILFRWAGSYWPPFNRGIKTDYNKCD